MQLPDDPFVAATRRLLAAETDKDLEFVFSPEAADFNPFYVRTLNYHIVMTPWIEEVFPLRTARVLEIGCGAGAATFPVAHKCAQIDSFDIDAGALDWVASKAAAYGLSNVALHALPPDWATAGKIDRFVAERGAPYDLVLLPAVLEHMLIEERLEALGALWRLLRAGGALVVYDSPNRLYPFDMHSFRLPFFDWIPDEIALRYAARSPRAELRDMLDAAADKPTALYRIGRGVSYHEFDLAIGLDAFDVLNDGYSAHITHRKRNDPYEGLLAGAFEAFAPHVPMGFTKAFLELVLRKKWNKVAIESASQVVDDLMPHYRRPYKRLQGEGACLVIDVGAARPGQKLALEVWRHAWSGTLAFLDEAGQEFHAVDLWSEYQCSARQEVELPPGCRRPRLTLRESRGTQGVQAWILGVGAL